MKNNKITLSQFWFSMLLSCLIAVLFIDNKSSIFLLAETAAALGINIAVVSLYKGKTNIILRSVVSVYFTVFAVSASHKFIDYMYTVLDFKPLWLTALLLFGFAFFCTVKGIEAVSRAATIIGFFTIVSVVYILICALGDMSFNITFDFDSNVLPPLVLLFPSAAYVLVYDNITENKPYVSLIYSAIIFGVIFLFSLLAYGVNGAYPIQEIPENSHVGVFRAADFLLLGFLSVSALYITSLGTISLFEKFKHKYLAHGIYIAVCMGITITASYAKVVGDFLLWQPFALILTAVTVLTILVYAIFGRNIKSKL